MARLKSNKKLRRTACIPEELLFSEILARLPVKSLARFRCVCRSWRAGVADPAFVRRHHELSPASMLAVPVPSGVDPQATSVRLSFHQLQPRTMETERIFDLDLGHEEGGAVTRHILATHCDGLVAVTTWTDQVVVCNPATREVVALPLGSHNAELDALQLRVTQVAIGYDQWRKSYVVARYFYRRYDMESRDYDIGHEVFTLGGSRSQEWEATQDPPLSIGSSQRPICTRRAFYWHTQSPAEREPRLVRFGLERRAFDAVPRPPTGWNVLDDMTELDGKLCYVHRDPEVAFEVWLADEEDDALQWSLRCRIDLTLPFDLALMAADGDELVAVFGGIVLCRYDARRQAMASKLDIHRDLRYRRPDGTQYDWKDDNCWNYFLPYSETLVSPTACNN